ncbi:MAG: PspC domain-containing protein [Actinobacteria bacterium]|nr:PspC domain-containing protein [Actinomycetota bacterium]
MNEHAAPRRILRSRQDRLLGGVAAGFGRYLGIDPAIVRLAFVALAFVGGLGVLLYLVAWVIVPDEPATAGAASVPPPARPRSVATWTVVILATAVLVIAGIGRVGLGLRPGIVWALALIGFGVALLWLRSNNAPPVSPSAAEFPGGTASPSATPPAPTPPGAPFAPFEMPAGAGAESAIDPTAPSGAWTVPPIAESPLRRAAPVLGRIVLVAALMVAALGVTCAALLAIEGPGSITVTPLETFVSSIVVAAVAIAAGIRLRRLVDTVPVAAAVIAPLAVFAWIGVPFHGGFGTREIRPTDAGSVARRYQLGGGELVVDLGAVDLGAGTRSISATVAAGRLEIDVPDAATVALDAHVNAGAIDAFGITERGVGVARHSVDRGAVGTLRVQARVGFGNVVVRRASEQQATAKPAVPAMPVAPGTEAP